MQEALRLLVVGMGTVFSFLTLLVLVMYVSARLLSRFEDPVVEAPGQVPGVAANDAEIALAIAVAEHTLRGKAE
jgi:sodium pump decarboxylase gamma subunit